MMGYDSLGKKLKILNNLYIHICLGIWLSEFRIGGLMDMVPHYTVQPNFSDNTDEAKLQHFTVKVKR